MIVREQKIQGTTYQLEQLETAEGVLTKNYRVNIVLPNGGTEVVWQTNGEADWDTNEFVRELQMALDFHRNR